MPITLTRSSTFFERVKLSVTNVPSGWTAPPQRDEPHRLDRDRRVDDRQRPGSGRRPVGTTCASSATNQGRTDYVNVPVTVVADDPTAGAPVGYLTYGVQLGSTVQVRVAWPAATDPSSTIAGYEVQTSINGGTYGYTVATSASVREVLRSGRPQRRELPVPRPREGQRRALERVGDGRRADPRLRRR